MSDIAKEQRFRSYVIKELRGYLAGDGSIWGRMASSHAEAVDPSAGIKDLAEYLKQKHVSLNQVAEFINSMPLDLLKQFLDQ